MVKYGHILVTKGGAQVHAGDKVRLFNGEVGTVMDAGGPPREKGALGEVILSFGTFQVPMYPEVCGMKWVEKK